MSLLFIHIPKNAGKSVESLFGFVSQEELVHYRWRNPAAKAARLVQKISADRKARTRIWGLIDMPLMAQHLTLSEIGSLGILSQRQLHTARKFAVCRNPYDRAVSTFMHVRQMKRLGDESFYDFWQRWPEARSEGHPEQSLKRCQWEFCVGVDGKNGLDRVCRFERLADDLHDLQEQFGLRSMPLPRIGTQRVSQGYREFYDDRSRRLIGKIFQSDLDYFKYTF